MRCHLARDVEVSLDGDRHTEQRPDVIRARKRSLRAVRLAQRPGGIHGLERPQPAIDAFDAPQARLDELAGREASVPQKPTVFPE